ncbi:SDR family NAD(P)-dependent oxidoreductase [Steroidobacter flavus]|uniref:SDR family NAD(P)-dependent oxidoreductase n=1 Tax=Steroidobacter flavus TaxID=1842136 RepID=A0ABV8T3G5_9GAMM
MTLSTALSSFDLHGKVAVVTGSTRGIGCAISEAFAAAGAAIVAHSTDRDEVDARVADWSARGWRVAGCVADLGAPDGVRNLHRSVESSLGTADILVLNASVEIIQPWRDVTEESMLRQSQVNLHATVGLIQAFLPAMSSRDWGRILAIGSVQEERPNAGHWFYSATKAAQTSMILNLARNERAPGVTFNVLRPGAILTDRNRARLADPAFEARVLENIPTGRIGVPADCAGAALLLCSDAGSYINGAVLAVDGGMRL